MKPSDSSAHPRATNYTNLDVAQGIAYDDFEFIEPTLLATVAKTTKDGQAASKELDDTLATRVAMGVAVSAPVEYSIFPSIFIVQPYQSPAVPSGQSRAAERG